jgi:hypothetical protein
MHAAKRFAPAASRVTGRPAPGPSQRSLLTPLALVAAVAVGSSGCRLCCNREDIAYPAYGGIWQRLDRNEGRVGSLFDPAGARVPDLSPRSSVETSGERRSEILPEGAMEDRESPEDVPEPTPDPDTDGPERDQQFEERYRQFQEEKMLDANLILGDPAPPVVR